jgi:hypothetical protein
VLRSIAEVVTVWPGKHVLFEFSLQHDGAATARGTSLP